ncbi:MAG: type IV pili methyl-accepting chemotaxis transducer N-terminal domain-containing protein [Epsilonproteobacteria bacterium]|nr:type IV pili methyl-accepting chemotaxis transducer N-terminal domain-containing protein [Campylobacterota bacterium]
MKTFSASTKVKILGASLFVTIVIVIAITIYLNNKNKNDAYIVNIAGKERMLTQKITKNIFYLQHTNSRDFTELDGAIEEFKFGINFLLAGDELLGIAPAPTEQIAKQIYKIKLLWEVFVKNTDIFKNAIITNDAEQVTVLVNYFQNSNNQLLVEIEYLVSLYTEYFETKNQFIKNFQYTSFAFLIVFALYSIVQLRQIERHAREFIEKSKQIYLGNIEELEPLKVDTEKEFVEVADNINCFINKISVAMQYSQTALDQSKMASERLEELTDEFTVLLGELEINENLDRSEDIVIESTEELLKTTKKLQNLKNELTLLLENCRIKE